MSVTQLVQWTIKRQQEKMHKKIEKKKFKQWNICHLVASWRKCSNCWVASLYCNPSEDYFFTEGDGTPLQYGEGDGTPLQYSCLENPMDRGAWWAAVHGVVMSWTWMSDFTFTFHFHALEKDMAIHSSILAWRIPGTGEPGGLLSMGSHRVRHDWSDLAATAAAAATWEVWSRYNIVSSIYQALP